MVALPLLLRLARRRGAGDQAVERQHVLTITAPDIDGGILSEITWDNGALLLQGVVANPDGSLSARYVLIPAKGTTLDATEGPDRPVDRVLGEEIEARSAPPGVGSISSAVDSKMPMYGIASLEQRMGDAHDMGGMQQKVVVRLGKLVLHERESGVAPVRRRGVVVVAGGAQSHRLRGRQRGPLGRLRRRAGRPPAAEGRLHAAGVVRRREGDRGGGKEGRRPPLGHQRRPAAGEPPQRALND